jgi:fibronectin type 3 domain-containing protein
VPATSFVDTAVRPGTAYTYRVAARNANGSGAFSDLATATPTTVPTAPTLTASGGRGVVTLTWTVPTSDGGLPVTSWAISRGTAAGAETPFQTLGNGTSYVDNTVTAGTTYYYRVAAVNANGAGTQSNEAAAAPRKGH